MLPEVKAELIKALVEIIIAVIASGMLNIAITNYLNRGHQKAETGKVDAETDRTKAEAEQTRVETSLKLLDEYQEDRARLIVRVDDLEGNCRKLQSTVDFLVTQNNELQRGKVRQDTVIAAYIDTQEKLKTEMLNIKAELERYKRIVTNMFRWIRQHGLEPPTMEELERG